MSLLEEVGCGRFIGNTWPLMNGVCFVSLFDAENCALNHFGTLGSNTSFASFIQFGDRQSREQTE